MARAYATLDPRSLSRRPPAHAQPGWALVGDLQRRNLQSPGAEEEASRRVARALRHGNAGRMPVCLGARAHAAAAERNVCLRGARRDRREALPGARPLRCEAAVLLVGG